MIYIMRKRLFPEQSPKRSSVDFDIEKRIVIKQKTLICVACPTPSVAFNPVEKSFARIQLESIFGNVFNFIYDLVIGFKRPSFFYRKILR